jgi:5-methylcytosine-specific restriction enzyme A
VRLAATTSSISLVSAAKPEVYLSLNQGTTAVRAEFDSNAPDTLRDRAVLMRRRVHEYATSFDASPITLGSRRMLPRDYEAAHAFGRQYFAGRLPDEHALRVDLQEMAHAYLTLTFRGGIDPSLEPITSDEEGLTTTLTSLTEIRRYRLHRKIDRNPRASAAAKRFHGITCQVCGFNFFERYGALGRGYAEAHHLKPLASLQEGVPVVFDVATDFAILCANCHRMIHQLQDASDIDALKASLTPTR